MRHALFTALATAALLLCGATATAAGRPGQAPRPPQAPACVECGTLCPCSLTGRCECSAAHDGCGCTGGTFRWVETNNPNQVALYQGECQMGNYWLAERQYKRLTETAQGDRWEACTCPVAPPTNNRVGGMVCENGVCRPAGGSAPTQMPPQTYMQYAMPTQRFSYGGAGGGCSSCR